MATTTHVVEWTCKLCGHTQSFLHSVSDLDGWPNKFDDMECGNADCKLSQDVGVRSCTIRPAE